MKIATISLRSPVRDWHEVIVAFRSPQDARAFQREMWQRVTSGMAALGAVHSGSEGEAEAPGETKNPTPESKG